MTADPLMAEGEAFWVASGDPLFLADATGALLRVNPACRVALGLREGEALAGTLRDRMHPDDMASMEAAFARLRAEGGADVEARLLGPDGEARRYSWRLSPANGGGVFGCGREISCRPSVDTAGLMAVLNAATQVSIIATDLRGTITLFNAGAERMLGYAACEVVGRQTPSLFHLPEEVASHAIWLRERLGMPVEGFDVFVSRARDEGHEGREWTYVRKDGARVPVFLSVTAVKGADGGVEGYLGIALDVSSRRLQEQELRRTREAAIAANKAKSEFLANMSHEVRTPMSAILGYAEMILDAPLGDEPRRAVEAMIRNGHHLLQIMNDILDLSKIEAGKLDMAPAACRPGAVATEALAIVAGQAREKRLDLRAGQDGPLPRHIYCDPTRLRQILVNLLGNAIKFTQAGVIELRARLEAGGEGGWLLFEVADQGIGMTEAEVARLFRPFSQADSSAARKYGGTGLGLSISQRLASGMGGRIDVRSSPGVGSVFTLRLPLPAGRMMDLAGAEGWATETPPASRPARTRLTGRVLLAEDNDDNQRILTYMLERLGLSVEVAGDGAAAIGKAEARPFDAILMDMQMPLLDGYAATRRLRQMGHEGVIIALTANAMHADEERCRQAGCTAYLSKPVDRARLAAVLGQFLRPGVRPAGASSHGIDPGLAALMCEYVRGLDGTLGLMRRSAAVADWGGLGRVAHQLKGSAGMYGLPELSEAAGLIESACGEGREAGLILELVEEAAGFINRARQSWPGRAHT